MKTKGDLTTIETLQTELGKKTIINMGVRYAYFIPQSIVEKANKDIADDYDKMIAIEGVATPIRVDLETGEETAIKTLRRAIKNNEMRCPIYFNSKTNPARLSFEKNMRTLNKIMYISILEYNDTGNVVFTFLKRKICWVRATGNVFCTDPTMYKLSIRKEGKAL